VETIDYKDVVVLRKFLTDRAKIFPRRTSGNCAKHQRQLATAVKRARYMAMLPYVVE
jgi:small subunit ribosomal protein S18